MHANDAESAAPGGAPVVTVEGGGGDSGSNGPATTRLLSVLEHGYASIPDSAASVDYEGVFAAYAVLREKMEELR